MVVMLKLYYGEKVIPITLPFVHKGPEVLV